MDKCTNVSVFGVLGEIYAAQQQQDMEEVAAMLRDMSLERSLSGGGTSDEGDLMSIGGGEARQTNVQDSTLEHSILDEVNYTETDAREGKTPVHMGFDYSDFDSCGVMPTQRTTEEKLFQRVQRVSRRGVRRLNLTLDDQSWLQLNNDYSWEGIVDAVTRTKGTPFRVIENEFFDLLSKNPFCELEDEVPEYIDLTVGEIDEMTNCLSGATHHKLREKGLDFDVFAWAQLTQPEPILLSAFASKKLKRTPTYMVPVRRLLCRTGAGPLYWGLALASRKATTTEEEKIVRALADEFLRVDCKDPFGVLDAIVRAIEPRVVTRQMMASGVAFNAATETVSGITGAVKDAAANVTFFHSAMTKLREMMTTVKDKMTLHKELMTGILFTMIVGAIYLLLRFVVGSTVMRTIGWILLGLCALLGIGEFGMAALLKFNDVMSAEYPDLMVGPNVLDFRRKWMEQRKNGAVMVPESAEEAEEMARFEQRVLEMEDQSEQQSEITVTWRPKGCRCVKTKILSGFRVVGGRVINELTGKDQIEFYFQAHGTNQDGTCADGMTYVEIPIEQVSVVQNPINRSVKRQTDFSYLWDGFLDFMFGVGSALPNAAKFLVMIGGAHRGYQSVREMTTALMEYLPQWICGALSCALPQYESDLVLWGSGYGSWLAESEKLRQALELSPSDILVAKATEHLQVGRRKRELWASPNTLRGFEDALGVLEAAIENGRANKKKRFDGQVPYYLYLYGRPGIGKSALVELLGRACAMKVGIPKHAAPMAIIYRSADKFWANFTNHTRVAVHDDVFNAEVSVRQAMANEIIRLISPSEYLPPQADCLKKNRVINLDVVIQTENNPDPSIPDINMEAFFRRRELYEVVLSDAFREACEERVKDDWRGVVASQFVTAAVADPVMRARWIDGFHHLSIRQRVAIPTTDVSFRAKEQGLVDMTVMEFLRKVAVDIGIHVESRKTFGTNIDAMLMNLYPTVQVPEVTEVLSEEKSWLKVFVRGVFAVTAIVGAGALAYAGYQKLGVQSKPVIRQYAERERTTAKRLERVRDTTRHAGIQSDDEFIEEVQKRILKVSSKQLSAYGFMVSNQHAVLPLHLVKTFEEDEILDVLIGPEPNTIEIVQRFKSARAIDVGFDQCLYKFDYPVGPLRRFWTQFDVRDPSPGESIARVGLGTVEYAPCKKRTRCRTDDNVIEEFWEYGMPGYNGQCGLPIIALKDRRVLGFHSAGANDDGSAFFSSVKRGILEELVHTDFEPQDLVETLPSVVSANRQASTVKPVGNFSHGPELRVIASVNMKREFKRTPMWDKNCGVAPAILDDKLVVPREGRNGVVTIPPPTAHLEFAKLCAKRMFATLSLGTPKRRMTDDEVIAGIDLTKSVGMPYQALGLKRTDFIDSVTRKLTPFGHREIEKYELAFAVGQPLANLVTPDLKSELLKLEKVVSKKTRTFQKLPFPLVFLGRRYFGHWHDELTKAALKTASAIGIDVLSRDWGKLYDWLSECEYHFDLDHQSYESTVNMTLLDAAVDVIDDWYGERDEARHMYAWNMMHAYKCFRNQTWLGVQGMPSGTPMTAPENTLTHYLLQAAAFKGIFPDALPSDFLSTVRPKDYGDDGLIGVREVAKEYNFLSVKNYLGELGYVVTDGKKSTDEQPFADLTDLTFLKKAFRAVPGMPIVGPFVTERKLRDQLSWCRDTSPEGLRSLADSILQFAFFHGREFYERFREEVIDCFCLDSGSLPLWDECVYRYYRSLPVRPVVRQAAKVGFVDHFGIAHALREEMLYGTWTEREEAAAGKSRWIEHEEIVANVPSESPIGVDLPKEFGLEFLLGTLRDSLSTLLLVPFTNMLHLYGIKKVLRENPSHPWIGLTDEELLERIQEFLKNRASTEPRQVTRQAAKVEKPFELFQSWMYCRKCKGSQKIYATKAEFAKQGKARRGRCDPCQLDEGKTVFYMCDTCWEPQWTQERMLYDLQICDDCWWAKHERTVTRQGNISTKVSNFYGNGNSESSAMTSKNDTAVAAEGGQITKDYNDPGLKGREKGVHKDNDLHEESALAVPIIGGPNMRTTLDGNDHGVLFEDYHRVRGLSAQDIQTTEDEMATKFLRTLWSIWKVVDVLDTNVEGTLIQTLDMSPFQELGPYGQYETEYALTAIEWLATMGRMWRGGLEVQIDVVAPRDASGTLFLVEGYGLYNISTNFPLHQTGQKTVFDYTPDCRTTTIKIQQAKNRPWMRPYYSSYDNFEGQAGVDQTHHSYGTFYIYQGAPNTKFTGFTDPVSIIISIRGGDDFEIQYFQPPSNARYTASVPTGFEAVRAVRRQAATSGATVQDAPTAAVQASSRQIMAQPIQPGRDQSLVTMARNFYQIAQFNVDNTFDSHSFAIPNAILVAQALLAQFGMTYWNGNLVFRLTPIANNWVSGAAIFAYVPMASGATDYGITRLSQNKHVKVDYSSHSPVELKVNFQHYVDYFTNTNLDGAVDNPMGELILKSVRTARFQSGGQTTFSFRLEVAWEDTSYHVNRPIGPTPVTLRGVTRQAGVVAEATTSDTALSSDAAQAVKAVSSLGEFGTEPDWPTVLTSLRDVLKRPEWRFSFGVPAGATQTVVLQDLANSPGGNAAYVLGPYVAYAGGTNWYVQLYGKAQIVTALMMACRDSAAPAPPPANTAFIYGPSPTGSLTPNIPPSVLTQVAANSRMGLTIPFRCSQRWAGIPAITGTDPNLGEASTNDAQLWVDVTNQEAVSDPMPPQLQLQFHVAAADSFRAGIWTGVPNMKILPAVVGQLPALTPYYGTYLKAVTPPPLGKRDVARLAK